MEYTGEVPTSDSVFSGNMSEKVIQIEVRRGDVLELINNLKVTWSG